MITSGSCLRSNNNPDSGLCSARGSIARANTSGDRGHPWRVPFVIQKEGERSPFTHTLAEGLEYKAKMEDDHNGKDSQ
ncbi:uncharacterized protein LOC135055013 isoform X3 [Pseudophryne corroboree]|uniref:uncharacterized protein LOC135055013 isoform X3 n=1 Tax=Pseudophryne corroboree TaxID=495146 RepID=UPI003081BBA8